MKITLEKIAALVKGRLEGDGAAVIEGVIPSAPSAPSSPWEG